MREEERTEGERSREDQEASRIGRGDSKEDGGEEVEVREDGGGRSMEVRARDENLLFGVIKHSTAFVFGWPLCVEVLVTLGIQSGRVEAVPMALFHFLWEG
jgi:hypothetical protein